MGSLIFSETINTILDVAIVGRWRVVEISDEATGRMLKVGPKEPEMTICFEDGYAKLLSGTESIEGDIYATDGQYSIARYMTTTSKSTDGIARSQVDRLYATFSDSGFYQLEDGVLELSGADSRPTIRAVAVK